MRLVIIIIAAALASCSPEESDIDVDIGPTYIPRGDATGAADITINNGHFAVAFAVDTAPPWGVARGGIVDIAIIRDGEIDYDIASLADFMPNNWSAWPTTYQDVVVESHTSDEVVVRTRRDWGDVDLDSRYYVRANDSRLRIITTMTNNGDSELSDILSGYVVWPDGGSLIGEPVVTSEAGGYAGWTASYGEDWVIGLHAPYSEIASYNGRDRYTRHNLAPGESRTLEIWVQIEDEGSLAPLVRTEIDAAELAAGRVTGEVVNSLGESVAKPAIVVSRQGTPLAWTIGDNGEFAFDLPVGTYEVYATAAGHGKSTTQMVTIEADTSASVRFDDVQLPGMISFRTSNKESGQPVDARIKIEEGEKPLIAYHGRDVFFTELDPVGRVTASLPPGEYLLSVSAGAGFTSLQQRVELQVQAGESKELQVEIPVEVQPNAKGWYSADMHHHSDVLDGFTEAEYVMRSLLAADVDVAFLSDHDSVINNAELRNLAAARGMPFIAATELSPSWAHFNAWPLDDGADVAIDTGTATATEVFAEARRMGADAIAVNHPYSEYGYFNSQEQGSITGDYDDGFDLVEIGHEKPGAAEGSQIQRTIERTWRLWNDGKPAYLVAGSDAHDVWNEESGSARSYVFVEGELTAEKFVAGTLAGRAYASQGPLVYPSIMFGTNVEQPVGTELRLSYELEAVAGLKLVQLIERGRVVAEQSLDGDRATVVFEVEPSGNTWFALVVVDDADRIAYTNPVWINSVSGTGGE